MARVDSSAATRRRFVAELIAAPSAVGARRIACARNAASTSGCDSRGEVHRVGRRGIHGHLERIARKRSRLCLEPRLVPVESRQFEPRRQSRHQAPERLEVRDAPAIGARRLFDRHLRAQRAAGEVPEDRIGQPREVLEPEIAVGRLGGRGFSGHAPARQRDGRRQRRGPQKVAPFHQDCGVRWRIGGWQTGHGQNFLPASSNVISVRVAPSFWHDARWYLLSPGCV